MTRYPNPNSKTKDIMIKCKPGREAEFKGFRETCIKDGLEMCEELYILIQRWLKEHHWPPGNPQTDLPKYSEPPLPKAICPDGERNTCPMYPEVCVHRKRFACKFDGEMRR